MNDPFAVDPEPFAFHDTLPPDATGSTATVLGLDIGGANIKAATSDGQAAAVRFPMWLTPKRLLDELVSLAAGLPRCPVWAVTMTGEMADSFATRVEGVLRLVEVTAVAAKRAGVTELSFYHVEGRFVPAEVATTEPLAIASANWHAMAAWVVRQIDAPSLLIDIGGTTTDIIPVDPTTGVATRSRTDFDRLAAGELVYVGGERTPVCSLVDSLPLGSRNVPVMREVFGTTDDCRLVLGFCAEDAEDKQTSDGRPRTMAHAKARLARMIGRDGDDLTTTEVREMARVTLAAATRRLIEAIAQQPTTHADRWILSGHAAQAFLPGLRKAYPLARVRSLSDQVGQAGSRVGPALACAQLRESTGRFR